MVSTFTSGFIWCVMWGLTFWMIFFVSVVVIWGIQAPFPHFVSKPKYTETVKTQSSEGLYHWIRLHVIWNVELNTLEDFPFISFHDFWDLGNFSTFLQCHKYTKAGITWLSYGLYTCVRLHLIWNAEFNTLNGFLCICAHHLGYIFGPNFPDLY